MKEQSEIEALEATVDPKQKTCKQYGAFAAGVAKMKLNRIGKSYTGKRGTPSLLSLKFLNGGTD